MAKSTSPFFQFPANTGDGMLGFGFPETSAFRSKSYFGNLIESGGPSNGAQVFGLYLAKSGPELIIGGRDSSKISGNMTVLDVDKSVSILRGAPCLRLRRTRLGYRVFGRFR